MSALRNVVLRYDLPGRTHNSGVMSFKEYLLLCSYFQVSTNRIIGNVSFSNDAYLLAYYGLWFIVVVVVGESRRFRGKSELQWDGTHTSPATTQHRHYTTYYILPTRCSR